MQETCDGLGEGHVGGVELKGFEGKTGEPASGTARQRLTWR